MRAACWTCRRRTIQCDQTSIPCAKCEKAGLECFETRPLRWVKGVAIRGKMRGRVLERDVKVADENSSSQLKGRSSLPSSAKSLTVNDAPPFALQDPHVQDLDRSSRFFLDYYNIRVAKLYILYDSERNPFRNLLTYAMKDSPLQMGIIAVAARHFANAGLSFDQADGALSPRFVNANVDALCFKRTALKALSTSLSYLESSRKDSIMASILLLIFLDLLESGIDGWKYHLAGAEGLIKLSHSLLSSGASKHVDSDLGKTEEEIRRFVAQQLSLVSTIGGALSGSPSGPQSFINFEDIIHQESIVRSFLGCPGFLLESIRYFSNQRHLIETLDMHDEASIQEHVQDMQTMLDLTGNFDCLKWASDSMQTTVPPEVETQTLSLLAEAYRNAILLYGNLVLRGFKTPAFLLYGNRVLRSFKTPADQITSHDEELVLQSLNVIDSLQCHEALFKCLLWPTFIAGIECQTDSQQRQIAHFLKRLWDSTCCLNVINASKILDDHWKRNDVDDNLTPDRSQLDIIEQGWLLI